MSELNISLKSSIICGRGRIDRIPAYLNNSCRRVLILRDPAVKQETVQGLSDMLTKKGKECVIYSDISRRATGRDIDPIIKIMNKSFTQVLIAVGGVRTINLARFAAAAFDSSTDFDDILDSTVTFTPSGSLIYIEIPSSIRFPCMFTSLGVITDGRNRAVKTIDLKINAGLIVKDPELYDMLPAKTADSIFFEIILTAVEALGFRIKSFLTDSILESALVKMLLPDKEYTVDELSDLALSADFVYSVNGPGSLYYLCYVINAVSSVPKSFIAAVLMPHFFEYYLANTSNRVCSMLDNTDTEDLLIMLRKKIKLKNLPIRLSELGVKKEMLPLIAEMYSGYNPPAGRVQIIPEDELLKILRKAF